MDSESDILASGVDLAQALASANEFTAQELAANRAGRIAPSQLKRLWTMALDRVRTSLSALLGWLLFVYVVKTLVPNWLFATLERVLGISLFALFGLITISSACASIYQLFASAWIVLKLLPDIIQGAAIVKEGRVRTSSDTEKVHGMGELYEETAERFSYVIGDEYLAVSESAHRVLRPYSGSSCRVFLTPRSRLLLSIEPTSIRHPDRLL